MRPRTWSRRGSLWSSEATSTRSHYKRSVRQLSLGVEACCRPMRAQAAYRGRRPHRWKGAASAFALLVPGDCSVSSNPAANGRAIRCARTAPFPRSRSLTLRACSSSAAGVSGGAHLALASRKGESGGRYPSRVLLAQCASRLRNGVTERRKLLRLGVAVSGSKWVMAGSDASEGRRTLEARARRRAPRSTAGAEPVWKA